MITNEKRLKSNFWKFAVFFITQRRMFWPLLTVYFLTFPDNSLRQIGIFLAIGQIGGFLFEIPSGYISDKIGHKKALIISKISLLVSSILFSIGGNFYIFSIATIFFNIGIAFSSGTFTAFSHEILLALKMDHLYSKIIGKITSKTFIISAIILALIPFTIKIDFRLPFIISAVLDFVGLLVVISFFSPIDTHADTEEIKKKNFIAVFKEGKLLKVYPIFILSALLTSIIISSSSYRDVYQQHLGVDVVYLGIFFALSRIVAAVVSNYIHVLYEKITAQKYYFMIITFYILLIISMGIIQNKWFVVTGFIILIGSMWGSTSLRTHYELEYIKNSKFKATILSFRGLFQNFFTFFTNIIIAILVGSYLYSFGYIYFGIVGLFILFIAYYIFVKYGVRKLKLR